MTAYSIVPVGRQRFLFRRHGRGGLDREERGPVKVQAVVQQHVTLLHGSKRDAHHGRRRTLLRDRRRRSGLLLLELLLLLINSCLCQGRNRVLVVGRRRGRVTITCNDTDTIRDRIFRVFFDDCHTAVTRRKRRRDKNITSSIRSPLYRSHYFEHVSRCFHILHYLFDSMKTEFSNS